MSKLRITMVVVVVMLCTGGCLEMVTPAAVRTTQEKMVALTESVDAYQQTVTAMTGQMQADKFIGDQTAENINNINAKIDRLQPVVTDAVQAVLTAEYSGDKLRDIITGVGAANTATAPVNPYAPLVDAGTKLLLGVLGLGTVGGVVVARNKNGEAQESKAKYTAHKQGTEEFKLMHPEIALELYDKIGEKRGKLGVS